MKYILCATALMAVFSFKVLAPDPITGEERAALLSYRQAATTLLVQETKGLSETQLHWKHSDSSWSIANCVEHITMAEKAIFDWMTHTLQQAPDPALKKEVKLTDDQVKSMVENRETKVKAAAPLEPGQLPGDFNAIYERYIQQGAGIDKYIGSTQEALHNYAVKTPVGTLDTYQLLLLLTAHTRRHTAQIIELKGTAGFPK